MHPANATAEPRKHAPLTRCAPCLTAINTTLTISPGMHPIKALFLILRDLDGRELGAAPPDRSPALPRFAGLACAVGSPAELSALAVVEVLVVDPSLRPSRRPIETPPPCALHVSTTWGPVQDGTPLSTYLTVSLLSRDSPFAFGAQFDFARAFKCGRESEGFQADFLFFFFSRPFTFCFNEGCFDCGFREDDFTHDRFTACANFN